MDARLCCLHMRLLKSFLMNDMLEDLFWSFYFHLTTEQFHAGREFAEEIVVFSLFLSVPS